MKKHSYTRTAFLYLLIPFIHLVVCFIFGFSGHLIESLNKQSVISMVFSATGSVLLFLLPLVQAACGFTSFIFQVKAFRNKESKTKNAIMLGFSLMYWITAILLSHRIWQGILSV